MYLTKVTLDVNAIKKFGLSDAYKIHGFAYSCLNMKPKEERLLYVEKNAARGCKQLLLLSQSVPEIREGVVAVTTEVTDNFLSEKQYRFEVLMNPVRKNASTGKREPVIGQLPLLEWFKEHSKKWGFELDIETLEARTLPSLVLSRDGRECRFHRVKFSGRLEVVDEDAFKAAFKAGLGHAKAFGFGLLQLMPF